MPVTPGRPAIHAFNKRYARRDGSATGEAALELDAPGNLALRVQGRPQGLNGLSPRMELTWVAGEDGLPSINASIGDTVSKNFEVLGTNASADDVTYHAEGGILFTTDGADGDGVILLPHLDAGVTPWASVTWGSDQETAWECQIQTGASIATSIIWAGLKLTNTATTATDADQAFFRYEDDVNDGEWQAIYSIANVDVAYDTGIAVAASTDYHLAITIDSARVPRFYINGVLVLTGTALTTAKDFIPYIGVEADGAAAAATLVVRGQAISRKFA